MGVKYAVLAKFFNECEVRRFNRLHRTTSRQEWATEIGISPTTFSEVFRGLRRPTGSNLDLMSQHPDIGERIKYIVASLPDENSPLAQVLTDFDDLPKDEQERFATEIQQKAEANRKKKGAPHGNRATD